MNPAARICLSIYRRLAHGFPHEFEVMYGADVIRLGEDVIEEIWKRHGFFGLLRLLADLAVRVPAEYLTEFAQDLRYAFRTIANTPGFAIVSIVSLGLAIGINTSAFTGISSLLRDLPATPEPKRLVALESPVAYPYFERYRDQHALYEAAAYIPSVPFKVALGGKPERVYGHLVSPEYFSVLGTSAMRGRMFRPEMDKPGAPPVVILSERFWRTHLNADPDAVGKTLRVDGQLATIAGIAPPEFRGVAPFPTPADLFMPVTVGAGVAPELSDNLLERRDLPVFKVVMRLAPGATTKSAQAAVDTITRQMDRESSVKDRKAPRLIPGGTMVQFPPEVYPILYGFTTILYGLILSIACMNLANMLMARASGRRKEIAIRLSVGASRFRIVRQLLTESVVLALCGGAAGLVFAYWYMHYTSTIKLPLAVPIDLSMRTGWQSWLFSFGVSMIAGIGFGLAPALQATKTDVTLRAYRRFSTRNLRLVWQVAGSLMLLLITGFLVIGLGRSTHLEVGSDDTGLYLLSVDPVHDGYSTANAAAFFRSLPEKLQRPVALAEGAPLTAATPVRFSAANVFSSAVKPAIGARYFEALGVPVLRGREFTEREQLSDQAKVLPAILSETAAQELFKTADPLGRRISEDTQSYEVVGVVRDLKSALDVTSGAVVYVPLSRDRLARPQPFGLTLMVRGPGGPEMLAKLDPNLSVFSVRTLRAQLDEVDAYLRFGSFAYASVGLFGLILASVGLAGVTAYSVARRRKEIGIRMALGARQGQVLRLVMQEGAQLVVVGSVLGFAGAYALSRALSTYTNQIAKALATGVDDPLLLIGAPLLLAGLAMLACYLPARKSTRIDPLVALRDE